MSNIESLTLTKDALIGSGATVSLWSDRHACTVIDFDDRKQIITVQRDNAVRADKNGMSDCQSWEYSANENGQIYRFKMKDGKWRQMYKNEKGNLVLRKPSDSDRLTVGFRNEYYDFTF